jgi:UDP-glucose 4-epimerase
MYAPVGAASAGVAMRGARSTTRSGILMTTGIVGARGFVGSYLLRHLNAVSPEPVRVLLRTVRAGESHSNSEVVCGDLLSPVDCERFAAGVSVIYYLAHCNTPVSSDRDQANDAYLNLIPLLNLLRAIQTLKTKPHIVYFSSGGGVYSQSPTRIPFRETDPCEPFSSYGIQKLAAEQYLSLAARRGQLTCTVLRVSNAYGTLLSRQRMQGLIGVAVANALNGLPLRVFGNPGNVRDYIHLSDVCTIAAKAAVPTEPFTILNVGSGQGYSVREVLGLIQNCAGQTAGIETYEDPQCGKWLTDWVVLDISKARQQYGWAPAVALPAGIQAMFDAAREL